MTYSNTPFVRNLGLVESYYDLLETYGTAGFVLSCEFTHQIEVPRLEEALLRLLKSSDQLSYSIDRSSVRRFVTLPPSSTVRVVEVEEPPSVTAYAERMLSTSYSSHPSHLFQITILKSEVGTAILIRFHHARFDAHSAFIVLESLLKLYASGADEYIGLTDGGVIEDHFKRRQFGPLTEKFEPADDRLCCPPRFIHKHIEGQDYRNLRDRCRKYSTTVTASIAAAMLKSFSMESSSSDANLVSVPVSLRRLLPNSLKRALMVAVGFSLSRHNGRMEMWELAGEIKQAVEKCINTGSYYPVQNYALNDLLRSKMGSILNKERLKQSGTFVGVSSAGVIDLGPEAAQIGVSNVHFYVALANLGAGIFASANAFKDRLNVNFTYRSELMEDFKAETIVNRAIEYIT